MQKNILFYKFTPISDPEAIRLWQSELCQRLNLKGRLIIATQGINGTLSGDIEDLRRYKRAMNSTAYFKKIDYKWSDGTVDDYPKLSVKVRDELVTLDPDQEFDVFNHSKGLKPAQWDQYLKDNPDVLVLDARNEYESDIGVFNVKNLVKPKIKTFKEIKEHVARLPKDKPVLTYCTGDIRCEYLSAYMQDQGFGEVYHLDGGIVKYGQEFKDKGFWDGKCYVFDKRMSISFSPEAKTISACTNCDKHTSVQVNCLTCNKQIVLCKACANVDYKHC